MVREVKEILQLLGWGNGFRIPIANDTNKQLEKMVEELLKKKAEMVVNIEAINEKRETMKKHFKSATIEQDNNQKLINSLSQQLNQEITLLKDTEAVQKQKLSETREMKRIIKEMDDNIDKLRADINNNTNKMNALKESLNWGEDALFAWGEELTRENQENEILEKYKQQDEYRFQKLDLERQQVETKLIEARAMEQNEADRYRVLTLQLENISKLYKEAYHERERLMKVWHDAVNLSHNREVENKRLIEALCEIKNKSRNKCTELYEHRYFDEELQEINEALEKEELNYRSQYQRMKDIATDLESSINHYNLEKELRKKTTGHIGGNIVMERMKNSELQTKNKARLLKYNKLIENISNLQQEYDVLKVDTMTNEQKYRNAHDMYDMSCKASEEETREAERLYVFAIQLKQEINSLKEKEVLKRKDLTLLKRLEKELAVKLKDTHNDLEEVENRVSIISEETVLKQQITELQDKCSGKEEKEEIEAEIKELEPQETALSKENLIIRMRLKNLQKEYQDKIAKLSHGEDEKETLSELYKTKRMHLHAERKRLDEQKEDLQKQRLHLNLLLMRENYLKENIAQHNSSVGKLERQRAILEVAMKERKQEIELQKEMLIAKKTTLLEEKAMLGRTVEHLNLRIKQVQSKYALALDLLEKDESGKQLSIAHFKIKLAQEKYDLQLEGDELEAKINKTEKEILAMENTLKLLTAANENYKFTLEAGNKEDPEIIEKEAMERKYSDLKRVFKEDSEVLDSVRKEIETLASDIGKVKCIAKELEEDWKIKEKEVTSLEKDLANKQIKLDRASTILVKLLKDIRKIREPQAQRRMAQKDIDIKIQEERNRSVLQQFSELIINYVETKPLVNRYLSEYGLRLPNKFSGVRSYNSSYTLDSARSKMSARSESSIPSVVNLDPDQLFVNESPSSSKIK